MSTYASVAAGGRGDGGGAVVANTAVSGRKDDPTPNNPTSELILSFRQKANFMKHWKPASTPSNRDRLELYAWHKQAVSGDAPSHITALQPMTPAEKAKYNAWRNKAGIDAETSMRNYIQEAERQVRVYGYAIQQPNPTTQNSNTTHHSNTTNRGLAAIPLLCAAASEQREAYLRRIQNTHMNAAWWKRQEPLTATPGSIPAIPETLLLTVASFIEYISIRVNPNTTTNEQPFPIVITAVVQSYFWPLHNAFLAVWMGWILIASIIDGTYELTRTILWGSRRTGRTLSSTWNDEIVFAANSVHTLTESHQPVSARVAGLVLQPLPWIVSILQTILGSGGRGGGGGTITNSNNNNNNNPLWMSSIFVIITIGSWWYWCIVLPWFFIVIMLGTALLLGNCFAVIELAAHV